MASSSSNHYIPIQLDAQAQAFANAQEYESVDRILVHDTSVYNPSKPPNYSLGHATFHQIRDKLTSSEMQELTGILDHHRWIGELERTHRNLWKFFQRTGYEKYWGWFIGGIMPCEHSASRQVKIAGAVARQKELREAAILREEIEQEAIRQAAIRRREDRRTADRVRRARQARQARQTH
ncbi:MAG: hypothetical protein Q9220_006282 [cf. Caloplaca sp. 1 TL-2023]